MISLLKTHKEIEKEKEIQKTKDFLKEFRELCFRYDRDVAPSLQIVVLQKPVFTDKTEIKQ